MTLPPKAIVWINRNLRIILAAFAVALLTVGYFLFIQNTLSTVLTVERASVKTLKVTRDERMRKLSQVRQFVERYEQISAADVDRLARILPRDEEVPLLFNQLPALVTDAGLQLDSVSFSNGADITVGTVSPAADGSAERLTAAGKTLRSTVATLAVSGGTDYTAFKRFLDSVEKNLRLLDITTVSFNTVLPPPGTGEVTGDRVQIPAYSVTLQTYSLTP
jgi:hypothetical protein